VEEQKRKEEEQRKKVDEEQKKKQEEQKKKTEEEKKQKELAEKQRQLDEQKLKEEEQRKKVEEQKQKEEEDRKKQEQERVKQQELARKQREDEQKRNDSLRKQQPPTKTVNSQPPTKAVPPVPTKAIPPSPPERRNSTVDSPSRPERPQPAQPNTPSLRNTPVNRGTIREDDSTSVKTTQPSNPPTTQPVKSTTTQTSNPPTTQPVKSTTTQPVKSTTTQPVKSTTTQPSNPPTTQPVKATTTPNSPTRVASNPPVKVSSDGITPPIEWQKLIGWCGTISRQQAEDILKPKPIGNFLLRYSENAKSYVLSYTRPGPSYIHSAGIFPAANGMVNVEVDKGINVSYVNLLEFVTQTRNKKLISSPVPV